MRYCFLVCIVVYWNYVALSQCSAPIDFPAITCTSGLPLADNVNIGPGQTYSFNGTGGSFNNVNISGGTLILCGSATITNTNFNSGQIQVNGGATMNFAGTFNVGNNVNFYNLGNATFNQNISIQGSSNFIYNGSGATITVNGNLTFFNSGQFINDGTAIGQNIVLNTGASLCFGNGAVANVVSIQNNATSPLSVPTGTACVSYTSTFTGNAAITAAAGLQICQKPGATNPDPAVIGAAIVFPNCSVCPLAATTPVRLVSFGGNAIDELAILHWVTGYEENARDFIVQRGSDGAHFDSVGAKNANNLPSAYTFTIAMQTGSYYRLKMEDIDGRVTYSQVIYLPLSSSPFHLTLLSNPVLTSHAELSIWSTRNETGQLTVFDYTGKTIRSMQLTLNKGSNLIHFDMATISRGQYFIQFTSASGWRVVIAVMRL